MGRPKGKKKTIQGSPPSIAVVDVPAPTAVADEDDEERRRFVEQQRMFSDREVQRRITAIEAIRDAEIENLLSRLRLLRSCLKKEQLRTPVLQFFRENLPNLSVVKKEDDGIFEPEWKEKVGGFPPNNATGTNVLASLGRGSTLPSTDLGPDFSAQSFKLNLLGATQLPIPGSALETPYLGVQDTFQTPGVTTHRLSFGMTPKTLRLPKHGEMLLSVHGSPLGVFGEENLEAIHESGDSFHDTSL